MTARSFLQPANPTNERDRRVRRKTRWVRVGLGRHFALSPGGNWIWPIPSHQRAQERRIATTMRRTRRRADRYWNSTPDNPMPKAAYRKYCRRAAWYLNGTIPTEADRHGAWLFMWRPGSRYPHLM